MSDLSIYVMWSIIAVALALADRFLLKRGQCNLIDVIGDEFKDGFYRVRITFNAKPPLIFSQVMYTLRDINDPTTVISGKTRTLEFSKRGVNSEYLLVKADLLLSGEWVVDVKIESIGCRINPFYKILPHKSHLQRMVQVIKE